MKIHLSAPVTVVSDLQAPAAEDGGPTAAPSTLDRRGSSHVQLDGRPGRSERVPASFVAAETSIRPSAFAMAAAESQATPTQHLASLQRSGALHGGASDWSSAPESAHSCSTVPPLRSSLRHPTLESSFTLQPRSKLPRAMSVQHPKSVMKPLARLQRSVSAPAKSPGAEPQRPRRSASVAAICAGVMFEEEPQLSADYHLSSLHKTGEHQVSVDASNSCSAYTCVPVRASTNCVLLACSQG